MDKAELHIQIALLCEQMGADKAQAEVMAMQLIKRSTQLAKERSISDVEALDYLLRVVKSGREGITPPKLPLTGGSSSID